MAKKDLNLLIDESVGSLPLHNHPPVEEGMKTVAYHRGPEEVGFCGKQWQRGVAQPVTADEWAAMRARGDFDEFDFTEEK